MIKNISQYIMVMVYTVCKYVTIQDIVERKTIKARNCIRQHAMQIHTQTQYNHDMSRKYANPNQLNWPQPKSASTSSSNTRVQLDGVSYLGAEQPTLDKS